MMRFLVKEFSCENLLCYVELSQYIVAWTPRNRPIATNKQLFIIYYILYPCTQ